MRSSLTFDGLVGRIDDGGVAAGPAHALADIVLALLLVGDRRIVADQPHEAGDILAEARLELRALGVGVLEHVVENRGGHDVVGVMSAFQ